MVIDDETAKVSPQHLSTSDLKSGDTLTPSEQRADYYVKLLKTEGMGFFSGKFRPEWIIDGKSVESELNPSDIKDYKKAIQKALEQGSSPGSVNVAMGFEAVGAFGNPSIKNVYYYTPAANISGELARYVSEEERRLANYLVISLPLDTNGKDNNFAKHLSLKGEWISGCYTMWGDQSVVLDNRGHIVPFTFTFLLKPSQMSDLLGEIKQKPDLIEEIFQKMYPGITGNAGLIRVGTQKLRIIERPTNYYTLRDDYYGLKSFFQKPQELIFSKQVGEK